MKLLKKIDKIKVKQDFVISDVFTFKREDISKLSKYVPTLDMEKSNFSKELEKAKKKIFRLDEKVLDKIIYDEFPSRLAAFNKAEWYLGHIAVDEIGVWRGAGGLPDSWTKGSLKDTANMIVEKTDIFKKNADLLGGSKRVTRAVPYFIRFKDIIQKDEFLLPIILLGSYMGREGMELMKGDVNDGCMRSIAYALTGDKTVKAYIGKL